MVAVVEHEFLEREQQFLVTLEELGCPQIAPWPWDQGAFSSGQGVDIWSWTRTGAPHHSFD